MSTKVVDFLNESGGSNFTETAPRPPTYGEENELQSNGGNSTKSSNSHKSHVSSKSHSSSKSGTSAKGDCSYSPATTPRKSNLEAAAKTSETMTGLADSELAAPLGFEPEGSAANSPSYSENGTPAHLKWAENLNYLLEDSEGVMLFRDFLDHELAAGSEELQFWFACQGFKKRKIDSADSLDHTTVDIQKAIYKRYVRNENKVRCISKDVRKEIADKISNKSPADPCIFDAAQAEVENYMRNETYPAFLRSQYYVQYVQNYMDSPKSSQSSGSNSVRPVSQSGLLPIVHEDKELESKDLDNSSLLPVIARAPSGARKSDTAVPSRHTETVTRFNLYRSKTPPYPGHVSYAPVSAQDSELQSLSSDALTDDTVSISDSAVDGCSSRLSKKPHRKADMKILASQNREFRTGLHTQIIPRTQYAPKDRNIAETDPKRYAALLIERLARVQEERETSARMEEKLRSINIMEVNKIDVGETLSNPFTKANTPAAFIPIPPVNEEETAESILDQHCLRIWKSSTQHTPSHSPPGHQSPPYGKSPDRHRDARKKGVALPASASSPHNTRSHHKKRDYVSYDIDDRNLIVCGTETHRHIHHHHHHHHSSRESSFKKGLVGADAQSCDISAWRIDNPQNLSADFSNLDYLGRGRTSSRKIDSCAVRKGSETSSNKDSGISLMESVKAPPNWNHPTSEKVMKWMLDSETVQEVSMSVQEADKSSSSHKRSHRLNQSASLAQQSRPSSKSKTSTRSTSVERGVGVLSAWSGPAAVMPNQPFVQDPSMPLLTPPNPTTQLEEAKRRLETESRTAGLLATPIKPKNFPTVSPKDKMRPPPGGMSLIATSHTRAGTPAHTMPSHMDVSDVSHILDSRLSHRTAACPSSTYQPCPSDTIIGIYMGQEPIPYRHQLPGRTITLAQIKTLVTKRGPFKYYFKRHSDEFGDGAGAVFEEISDDAIIVPMWQGKIVVKVEKLDL